MPEEGSGRLDPRKSYFITVLGKKGYGKSTIAAWLFDSYPYDRIVVDTTGDVGLKDGWTNIVGALPDRWPIDLDGKRQTLRWVPDPTSATYRDDLDRAVGLAFQHGQRKGHCGLWFEEVHEVAASNRTGPHMRRALRQGRHANLTMIVTDIRPITCDPLITAQADFVYCCRLPNPDDRATVAKNIGWDLKEPIEELDGQTIDQVLGSLPKYEYARYDAGDDELVLFPPLPAPAHTPINERHLEQPAAS